MRDELLDRFGSIPESVENLLRISLIRVSAHKVYLAEIKGKNERILFTFTPNAKVNPEGIPALLNACGREMSFTAYGNPYFTYRYKKTGLVETDERLLLDKTEEILNKMSELLSGKE